MPAQAVAPDLRVATATAPPVLLPNGGAPSRRPRGDPRPGRAAAWRQPCPLRLRSRRVTPLLENTSPGGNQRTVAAAAMSVSRTPERLKRPGANGSRDGNLSVVTVSTPPLGGYHIGALVFQLWDFAGDAISPGIYQCNLQPFINYNLRSGWALGPLDCTDLCCQLGCGERRGLDRPVGWRYFQGEPQRRAPTGLGNESAPAHSFVVVPPSAELGEAAKGSLRPLLSFRWVAALALLILLPAVAWAQQPEEETDTVPQRDLMDVISRVLKGKPKLADTIHVPPKVVLTVLPSFGVNPTN